MPSGATQDGPVVLERSDRMWSNGEGNGVNVIIPWEPVLEEFMMNLDPVIGPISV